MLERMLSARRGQLHSDEAEVEDDESKTRKHISFAMRVPTHLTRLGYLLPCILLGVVLCCIVLVSTWSRKLACAPSSDAASRFRFLGFDGPDSDFGSLGVPWCMYLFNCLFVFLLMGIFWVGVYDGEKFMRMADN